MTYPRLPFLLLPYARHELPGWGRMLGTLGLFAKERWAGAPARTVRGKWHGFEMTLDLADWAERQTYFLGRYYDLPTQLALRKLLRPGDCFVDVGANIGMLTLLAAALVGRTGRVIAVEPNPQAAGRIRQSLAANGVDWVTLHEVALADAAGELCLSVFDDHTGSGTLAPVVNAAITNRITVRVMRGDDLLADLPQPPRVLKLDVEGYEPRALRGLQETLHAAQPIVVTEAEPVLLQRAGSDLAELFDVLHTAGYRGFWLGTCRRRLRYQLALRPLTDSVRESNVVWLPQAEPPATYAALGLAKD